jgi:hypothetical protein
MKSLFLFLAVISSFTLFAQKERKSPHDTVSTVNGTVTVTYGRPYKKDRDIFGGLEKFGKVWRVGADEATTISFTKDVKFNGQDVKAGTYTLFAIPAETQWGIILNAELGQWGAYSYEEHAAKNVARSAVPVKKLDNVVEQLTIRFADDNLMVIEWDKTQVVVPLSY